MNDTSCNELKSILDAYLARAERSSLMPLSTNLPGNTGAKIGSALQSARDLVNMFCAKKETTEFENLSLAFRCLYMGIINHQDKVTLVKQHQHYVVFLNTKMLHKLALEELSIIYNVLTSGILSNIPSHGTLLKGVSPEVDFSLPLVTSFHFFVIQSMLQMISSKVQSIVKKSSSSDPSLLWKVACFFLGGSNFDSCLSLCAVSSSRKYHLNGLKMLSGFLKVAEFIGARSSNSQVHLATSALKLKVIQYQVYTDSKIVFELPQINDSLLIPFVRDLHDTLSKTSGSTNFPILEALKHTHSLYLNLTDKTTSPKSAHAPELQKSPNSKNETRRNLAPLKFDHTNHKMVKNFLLSSNPSFDTVSGICLILEAIPNKNLRKSHFLVLESCVAFLKSALANETIFLQCLKILIPVLSSILIREKEVDIIQELSILCFKFSRTYESIDGFHEVFQLDLAALCLCRNTETECHLKTRIEYSICALFDLEACKKAVSFAKAYVSAVPTKLDSKRVPEILAACISFDPESMFFFFGDKSVIEPAIQNELFHELLSPLHSRLCEKHHHLVFNIIPCLPKKLSLATRYQVSQLFGVEPSLMGFTSPRTSPEYIFTAGILVNNFKEDKLEVSVLKKIETYVLEWLKLAQEQDLCVHFPIFLGIVKTLSHAGFYLSCRKLIEEFKRSSFSNLRGLLDVEVLLCRCLLEIHEVDQLPLNLKNSGILFKTAYTGIASEYDDLINMKLMQLEFFINMCDQDKSIVKFDEVKSMIASRTEYNLSIESRDISLQRRLTIFATISRFSLLASRLSMILAQVSESLRNSKLSIKLLCSVLRKIDSLSGFDNMKTEATHLLLKGYELAFTASKRLGLSKDAIHFVDEFTKLNSSLCRSPIKSLNNFIGANYLMYANKKSDALRQFEMGRSDTWHSKFLNLIELVTCISVNFDLMSAECLESKRKDVISLLFARQDSNDSSQFVVPASQISGILLDVESLVIKIFGKGFSEDQQDSTNIFEMLTKAVLSVQLKLSEVEDSSAICNVIQMLDSSIEYLPNTGQIDFNTFRESALSISVINHCKDVLMRCGEGKYLRYLEIGTMHEINTLLNRFGFLLSFFGGPQQDDLKELLKTSFLIKDLAYSLPYDNQKALMTTQIFSAAAPLLPECGNAQNGKSIQDLKEKFYEDLLQLLPVSWTVVTLDICQVSGDLIISRLWAEADYPIVFKVPFDRREENKRNFNEYLRELKSIIADSNLSTKSTVTSAIKTKEDRKMWWKMRFELDSRLGALLQQIERSTIGGLVGVFGNFDTKVEECRIFEMELNKIWNAALGHTQETVQLDKTIVGLFYFALLYGQSGMSGFDLLADLTVYTAEQLQLHTRLKSGFVKDNDWIISHVSRLCVTRPYHNDTDHLILIPSHTCSYVPWESMTCLRGRSVSRMPSVSHLFESLARHKDQMKVYKDGSENLLYVVNPGSDLIKTQNRFKPVFDGLLGANGVAGEPPSEEWLTANLYRSNLYVYLGHGGGEQYLRSSALFNSKSKTEEQLPTTLLMGCSSSAYQEHGRLQPSSNIFNWLVCGAPAVMTNLWDITDKDIDIFSLSLFAEWGISSSDTQNSKTLAQAMINSRNACTLKYLNGAAPVLHGLPLKLK